MSEFLEIETKYDGTDISRVAFKRLAPTLGTHKFKYAESYDHYFVKSENEFLRYREPSEDEGARAELTFKKKHIEANNNVRTEVNLRVDNTPRDAIKAFCEGLGYTFNFKILKYCDIYFYDDANIVYYTVIDEAGKAANFIEIEANEHIAGTLIRTTREHGWAIVQKYEKLLAPLGITAQKRMKLSLFERYRKALPNG